jgi:hypothetical protein
MLEHAFSGSYSLAQPLQAHPVDTSSEQRHTKGHLLVGNVILHGRGRKDEFDMLAAPRHQHCKLAQTPHRVMIKPPYKFRIFISLLRVEFIPARAAATAGTCYHQLAQGP